MSSPPAVKPSSILARAQPESNVVRHPIVVSPVTPARMSFRHPRAAIRLVDFKVRILDGRAGTKAVTRVLITSADDQGSGPRSVYQTTS
jgi:hypothetical protein